MSCNAGMLHLDRVMETLNYEEDVKDPEQPVDIDQPESVGFNDVSFTYPMSHAVNLDHIKLNLESRSYAWHRRENGKWENDICQTIIARISAR